ncbi:MAG TPA: acyltransferase family protein [Arthrobacter sp.]|nr:acyltransferase family protein [Arthrobacter sp.]
MSSPQETHRTFLPEVQALRALAVLVVVAYHLEPRVVPGGFVGVDVFFVISGFLITGHLVREARRNGRIDLPAFWAGRVRRILPAALVAIAAVVVATLALAPVTQWGTIGQQALASVFSVQNWALAADSVDYLAAEEPPTALQHFWSLGAEEQFYLVWPLLVIAALALVRPRARPGRRSGMRDVRRPLLGLCGGVTLASLAYGAWLTSTGDPAAYFVTPARMWELGAGGLLALALAGRADGTVPRLPRPPAVPLARSLLALAGLAAIGCAVLGYDDGTPFPGLAAAVPVLGTMAVILGGRTTGPLGLHRLVEAPAVQWIGAVSYSLYLWHWPILVFFILVDGGEPGPLESLGLLGLGLLAAWAGHHFVETPARHWHPVAHSTARALAAGAVATVLAATFAVVPTVGQRQAAEAQAKAAGLLVAERPTGFGAASIDSGATFASANRQIVPLPAEAAADKPDLGRCVGGPGDATTPECEFGPDGADFTIALVGDSHAVQWWKALEPLARENGWRIVTYLKNSCAFTGAVRTEQQEGKIDCVGANQATLERLVDRGDVDAVLTAGWTGAAFRGDPAAGVAAYWTRLEDAVIPVQAIRDTPRPGRDQRARDCVAAHPQQLDRCGQDRSKAFEDDDWISAGQRLEPRVGLLDFSDRFCTAEFCPAVVGNVLVYRDAHHISDTYMSTLVPAFGHRLAEALRVDGVADEAGV